MVQSNFQLDLSISLFYYWTKIRCFYIRICSLKSQPFVAICSWTFPGNPGCTLGSDFRRTPKIFFTNFNSYNVTIFTVSKLVSQYQILLNLIVSKQDLKSVPELTFETNIERTSSCCMHWNYSRIKIQLLSQIIKWFKL